MRPAQDYLTNPLPFFRAALARRAPKPYVPANPKVTPLPDSMPLEFLDPDRNAAWGRPYTDVITNPAR